MERMGMKSHRHDVSSPPFARIPPPPPRRYSSQDQVSYHRQHSRDRNYEYHYPRDSKSRSYSQPPPPPRHSTDSSSWRLPEYNHRRRRDSSSSSSSYNRRRSRSQEPNMKKERSTTEDDDPLSFIHPKLKGRFVPAKQAVVAKDVDKAPQLSTTTRESPALPQPTADRTQQQQTQHEKRPEATPGATPDLTLSDCSDAGDHSANSVDKNRMLPPPGVVSVHQTEPKNDHKSCAVDEAAADQQRTESSASTQTVSSTKDCQDVSLVQIGSRVAVYWDGEDEYFEGTVTKQRNNHGQCFHVEYDDGDREWIDLSKHRFRLLGGIKRGREQNMKEEKANKRVRRSDGTNISESRRNPEHKLSPKEMKEPKQTLGARKETGVDGAVGTDTQPHKKEAAVEEDWVAAGIKRSPDDSSDSETDEEELMQWAVKMFGVSPRRPIARKKEPDKPKEVDSFRYEDWMSSPVHIPISEAVKLGRRRSATAGTENTKPVKTSTKKKVKLGDQSVEHNEEEARRKKELARPLTSEELRTILSEDDPIECSSHWVRRSVRQPSKSVLNSPMVKALIEKLKSNDTDMVVLKMKKYVNDPNAPCIVIDAVLDALEENTNCEALYIQNFNEGMRDEQVMHLLQALQRPSCKIWCLNIGETYNVKTRTWKRFADGLKQTKVTHMYASEHTITSELKEQIRTTIRDNRSKHNMHIDPDNLDTIVLCTHNWWNPINAKTLRPYLKQRGYEHMLNDTEAQGLRGSSSGATLS